MSRTKQIFILAFILAAAIIGRAIAINPFAASSVQANQGGRSAAQKWEYCAITFIDNSYTNFGWRGTATICYFQIGGIKEEIVEVISDIGKRYPDRRDALAKAIAKLGDEGWEMVAKESESDSNFKPLYFKRPKQ